MSKFYDLKSLTAKADKCYDFCGTKGRYLVRVYYRDSIDYFHTICDFERKNDALTYANELATHNGVLMVLVYTRAEKGKAPKIILRQYTTEGLIYLKERARNNE